MIIRLKVPRITVAKGVRKRGEQLLGYAAEFERLVEDIPHGYLCVATVDIKMVMGWPGCGLMDDKSKALSTRLIIMQGEGECLGDMKVHADGTGH